MPVKPKKKSKRKKKAASPEVKKLAIQPSVVVSGYYGFDNLGDELILEVLCRELKSRGANITVLSQNPAETSRRLEVNAIHRTSLMGITRALENAHILISGGGGLFQDVTGRFSTFYYGGLIHMAKFFDCKVCFWAQGLGPLNRPISRKMTASALGKCDKITLRDELSADLAAELTGKRPKVTGDPVWLWEAPETEMADPATLTIGISLRPWPDLTLDRIAALAGSITSLAQTQEMPVRYLLMPFQQTDLEPLDQLRSQLEHLKGPEDQVIGVEKTAVPATIGACDWFFGMRLHSVVLSVLQEVKVFGLIYDPKLSVLLEDIELQGIPVEHLERLSAETLRDYFEQYEYPNLNILKNAAKKNLRVLDQLLDRRPETLMI